MNKALQKLHKLINPKKSEDSDWIGAMEILLAQWQAVNEQIATSQELQTPGAVLTQSSGEFFRIAFGPWLAECFAPIHGGYKNQCALLAAYRQDRDKLLSTVLPKFQAALLRSRKLLAMSNTTQLLPTLHWRMDFIDAFSKLGNINDGAKQLAVLLGQLQDVMSTSDVEVARASGKTTTRKGWSALPERSCIIYPAAIKQLRAMSLDGTGVELDKLLTEAIEVAFKLNDSDSIPWRDPAVTYMADFMVQLQGGDLPIEHPGHSDKSDHWLPGHSWILIAVDDPLHRTAKPSGMLLLLRIDVLSDGCGVFYPNPSLAGHCLVGHGFQNAFRNAWQVVLGDVLDTDAKRLVDYRWSITVFDDSWQTSDGWLISSPGQSQVLADETLMPHRLRHKLHFIPLDGPSGEVAIAAALKSAVEQVPLDRSRAASACFAERKITKLNANPLLSTVEAINLKEDGLNKAEKTAQIPNRDTPEPDWSGADRASNVNKVRELVVAESQKQEGILSRQLLACDDFNAAWRELSQSSIWTQEFKTRQLAIARKHFREYCFATDDEPLGAYILNDMQRMPDDRDPLEQLERSKNEDDIVSAKPILLSAKEMIAAMSSGGVTGVSAKPILLSAKERDHERQAILLSQLRVDPQDKERIRPLRLIADSGMGKTTLLHRSLYEIANLPDGRIPILLTGLSHYLKEDEPEKFLKRIADRHLTSLHKTNCLEWLGTKAKRGEVVLLLDALDQTEKDWDNLASLILLLPQCPVLLTLRREALQSRASAFKDTAWDTVDVLPFSEDVARGYLKKHAEFYFKQLSDKGNREAGSVLTIPLILHLLKDFADKQEQAGTPLADFRAHQRNRYAIYDRVIRGAGGLIERGLVTLRHREQEAYQLFADKDDAIAKCSQLAWWQLKQNCFETQIPSRLKAAWSANLRSLFPPRNHEFVVKSALKQLNLVTAFSMIEDPNELNPAMAWRHRSFFEYLGGVRLAELFASAAPADRKQAVDLLEQIHELTNDSDPKVAFHWTLRFALSHAAAGMQGNALALKLIGHGNPWIVYESIDSDGLQVEKEIDELTRWLVHRDWSPRRDFTRALPEEAQPTTSLLAWWRSHSASGQGGITLSDRLLSAQVRDASIVDPLLDLMSASTKQPRWQPGTDWVARICEPRLELPLLYLPRPENAVLDTFAKSFVNLPEGDFDVSQYHDAGTLEATGLEITGTGKNRKAVPLPMSDLRMSSFVVTNEMFELYCPSHRRWRSDSSNQDDQPVVYVNWYMARSFCEWLTHVMNDGGVYTLPTEWQWEWACRWGNQCQGTFWWGDESRNELAWVLGNNNLWNRTHTRDESLHDLSGRRWRGGKKKRHPSYESYASPGLVDVTGNVWEWCGNRHTASGFPRALRGSSFHGIHFRDGNRCSFRDFNSPDHRLDYIGFRVIYLGSRLL